jgi:hypothetical protein
MLFCEYIGHNSLHIYQKEKYFEQNFFGKLKHGFYVSYTCSVSLTMSETSKQEILLYAYMQHSTTVRVSQMQKISRNGNLTRGNLNGKKSSEKKEKSWKPPST